MLKMSLVSQELSTTRKIVVRFDFSLIDFFSTSIKQTQMHNKKL